MEDFVGNNAKLIVDWGQLIAASFIGVSLFFLLLLGRKNRFYLPKGILGYSLATLLVILMIMGSLVLIRVTSIEPRMSAVIYGLEYLENKPAPLFNFRLLADDSEKTLADYKGKVVLLNYWATWCAPCIKEMPDFNKLQEVYADQGLVVIALSDEDRESLSKFAEKRPFVAQAAYSSEFNWADIQTERPITFLIDKENVIADYFTGRHDYEYFESKVKAYLN